MKTKITNRKNNLLKLTKVLMIGALISLGLKANAQCSADFTYVTDSSGTVTFTNTSTSSSGSMIYYWTFGDGTNESNWFSTFTHTYSSSGTYSVYMVMLDSLLMGSGCTDTIHYDVNVSRSSDPSGGACMGIVNAAYTYTVSAEHVSFYNTPSGSSPVYFWDFGDGSSSSTVGDNTHTYTAVGSYLVCLTVYETGGGIDSCQYCNYITIDSVGTVSGACMGIVNPFFSFTEDSSGFVFHTPPPSGSSPVYHWDFGDGTTSSATGAVPHTFPGSGTYYVCLSVHETDGGTDSCQYCTSIVVPESPSACYAHFYITQDSTDLYHYFIYNASTVASGAPSYLWDFGDGTTSTLEYPTHTYTDSSAVRICLTVSDGIICSDIFCDSIISPGRSAGAFTVTVVGTTEIDEQTSVISSLENYPNPFSNSTTINYSINKNAIVVLKVVDLLGNTIAVLENGNRTSGNYSTTLNSEGIAEGMYLLQLTVNNDTSVKKIIISK